jgi:hypothetical protein
VENLKLGLIALSVFLNFYLISELKKQSSAHMVSLENLGSRLQSLAKEPSTGGSDKSISNSALMEMVNTACHDEYLRGKPSTMNTTASDSQRLDQLQARVDTLQNSLSERAAAGGGGGKERKLKEEAQKLKQEILAQCVRK